VAGRVGVKVAKRVVEASYVCVGACCGPREAVDVAGGAVLM